MSPDFTDEEITTASRHPDGHHAPVLHAVAIECQVRDVVEANESLALDSKRDREKLIRELCMALAEVLP